VIALPDNRRTTSGTIPVFWESQLSRQAFYTAFFRIARKIFKIKFSLAIFFKFVKKEKTGAV